MNSLLATPTPRGCPMLQPPARRGQRVPARAARHACAERSYACQFGHGVRAGPQAMIAGFPSAVLDGGGTGGDVPLEPAVPAALEQLQPAIDCGLLGLKAHAALFSTWPVMTRA